MLIKKYKGRTLRKTDRQTNGLTDGRNVVTYRVAWHATKNKAGYTAISCGRVGRGGNKRFRLVFTDQPTNRRTDGRTKPLIELRVRN